MSQPTGQRKLEIFPESETEYFLKVNDIQITFVKDEQGNVTHLVVHQGGATCWRNASPRARASGHPRGRSW